MVDWKKMRMMLQITTMTMNSLLENNSTQLLATPECYIKWPERNTRVYLIIASILLRWRKLFIGSTLIPSLKKCVALPSLGEFWRFGLITRLMSISKSMRLYRVLITTFSWTTGIQNATTSRRAMPRLFFLFPPYHRRNFT